MSFKLKSGCRSSCHTTSGFSIPYVSRIHGGLKAGKDVFIQGAVPAGSDGFVVNLKCGESDGDDIAFQMKPQFTSNSTAVNSRNNGSWGKEEKLDFPLKPGGSFDLIIAVNSEGYQVFLSGQEVGRFQHRISLERVNTLAVAGGVSLTNVAFTEGWSGSSSIRGGRGMHHSHHGVFRGHSSMREGTWSFTETKHHPSTTHLTTELSLSNPVQNPKLPYVGPISGGLREGMALYVKGVVPKNADRFALNFKTGTSDNDDVAFQFNPRMEQNVTMNSFQNGAWGTEESVSDNPFTKGQDFEMLTAITSAGYQVYVNGKELYTFKHHIPLERVTVLNVGGDVALNLFGFIQNLSTSAFPTRDTKTFTSFGSSHAKWSSTHFEISQPVQHPNLPRVVQIPGGLKEGMILYMKGAVPTNADRFELNFKTGQSGDDDTAFHFNPRMDKNVAMNSVINGKSGTEEIISDNPFKKGEPFEMLTMIKPEGYQVHVNGKEQCIFRHRTPLERVSALNISGNVAVKNLEISQPIQNPNIPYVGQVPGGLKEGMALYMQGVVPDNADQFEINFKTGQSGSDDIAFHFNPRMGQKVFMNSFRKGAWGTEESVSDNPFTKGQRFKMLTAITSAGYQVYVNDKELCTFKHRLPLERVSTLNISGNVAINSLGSIQNWSTSSPVTQTKSTIPSLGSSHEKWSTTHLEISQPVQNPNLPRVVQIPGGLKEGMILYMKGAVPNNADRFEINFKTGQSGDDDTAFHFNPRMDKNVAMNSVINGKSGTEEIISDNPFKKGEPFEMLTVIKPEGYQVCMNGKEQCIFKHRTPLERVSALNISGDVAVKNLEISQPIQNPSIPYVGQVPGGLKEGMALYMQGVVPDNADQFEINFKTGQSGSDDIAFHFNPRMGQKVFMNSFRKGAWETEESVSDNPFTKGQHFKMLTAITSAGYQVYVNDKELCTFKHRLPLERLSTLNISGNVAINSLGSIQNWSTSSPVTQAKSTIPSLGSSHEKWSTTHLEISQPVQNPNIPRVVQIPGGLKEGMILYMKGDVPTNADRFELNFKTGQSGDDDTAFHFNPRMDKNVAMNSVINGKSGTEEIISDNPFKKGEPFEMLTIIKPEGYQVHVNGKEQCIFKHRTPLERVSALNISGDVTVKNLEISQPIQNPSIPYVGQVPGGLKEGMALYMQGVVPDNADQFEINFKTGQSGSDDIAFHFNPRMGQKVFMNSFRKGAWETEESVSDNPFTKGQRFKMLTAITSAGYQVYVNDKELCTFKHRLPLERVSTLNISGNVAINSLGSIQNWSTSSPVTQAKSTIPSLGSSHEKRSSTHLEISQPVQHANLPCVVQIPGGLKEGMILYMKGAVPNNADRFEINFKTGQSGDDDTAFHFNPRMDKNVAMNSVINGKSGTEEIISDNPFKKGEPFEMLTMIKPEGYQVHVNGKEQCIFRHRTPLERVSALNISGDVAVNNLEISQPIQNPNIPYVGQVPGGLKEGMALYMQGIVPDNADQFEINFKTGQSGSDDIAFHFNPQMGQKVVMNSFRNGAWGTEESVSDNPFTKGQHFKMLTAITSAGYQVYVNDKELCTFKHRLPLEQLSTLNISGNVAINSLGSIQNWSTSSPVTQAKSTIPSLGSSHGNWSTTHLEISQPVQHPNIPRVVQIPGGLKEGMILYMKGDVPTNADRFELNFKTGQSGDDDTAFHFNPRMDKNVAMNSVINGKSGTEEIISDNPFKKGEPFEMLTIIKPEGYQVHVNGKEQCIFKHRTPLERVSALNISGDVAVNNLEISQPIQNPKIPYVGQVPGGLKEGMALYMQGVVPDNADQFEINFKTGQSGSDDIAFHFNPQMGQKVFMNSFRNGAWETEESVSDNPFTKGQRFKMLTAITSAGYQVYVNDKELCTFKHRLPLERLSTLNISGNVAINSLGSIQNWSTSSPVTQAKSTIPSLGSSHGEQSTTHLEISQPVQHPNLPYVGPISGGLREGIALYLQGVVPPEADKFEINFKTGQSGSDDIAFHFNPRIGQIVALNSFRNGRWETQESISNNPFKKGEAFEMFTVIKSEGYQVYVNGKEHCTFKHRIPLEKVSTLSIVGGVSVNLLGFIQNWTKSSFCTKVKSTITCTDSSHKEQSSVHSEISQAVQNPSLPYVGPISGGLREGMALYLQGAVPHNADKFEINFKTGQSGSDDIAFHFNPQMDHKVAMNSFRNGAWETEESISDNPFKKGQDFEMLMVLQPEGYQVYVNGKVLYTFKHRIQLEKVSTLNIFGGVAVNLFGFIQNWSKSSFASQVKSTFTSLGSSHMEQSTTHSEILQAVQNPNLPYVGPISGGLREGMALYFQGVVPPEADKFEINFKTGSDDIAFHFNPQMGQNLAMNSFRKGRWETQESVSNNPFKKGDAFEMFMVIKSEGYQVYVNENDLYTFKHRIPLEKVSTLNIVGAVSMSIFGLIQNWSKSSFTTKVKSTITSLGSSQWDLSTIQSKALQAVQNPNLPYLGQIPGGLREGMTLYVKGVVPRNGDRFSINFKTGSTDNDDIAFHFNPRMGSKLVMNSLKSGRWGAEEYVSENPCKKGDAFEFYIQIKAEGYQVQFRDHKQSMFKHRIPFERVTTINVLGNVSISFLGFVMGM
ncbi:uncharacterized protein lgals4 isoform X2 [Danio aesculapii]|uniref:uncharacterized protein lgals4 isoform X2 n=1 Tax=Danio aesculapii TaxID=1142201 RepID=UPI0024BFE5C1|nr:uncharacterized protein lgals4 isoform X2 [Danio aesculapii]